ncbi:MAG: hypothetical protein J5848_05185 [Bacteroidales bacterium]|nr:hypothetical protein [Bacteroidales bacterium]
MKLKLPTINDGYLAFEICGKVYKISDYDNAIKENHDKLSVYYKELQEFPYTVRTLTNDNIEKIKDVPLYIFYRDQRISFYEFLKDNWLFENKLPLSTATNGLEVYYDLELAFRHFKNNDDYHSVIYETFRIIQDLHYLISTARWALIQAHRILHFRSGLVWNNGWEQLWTRATWLNNSIVMYDSCFDKITQAIWIGTESFIKQGKFGLDSLCYIQKLEKVYKECWRRNNLNNIPEPFKTVIVDFQKKTCGNTISQYAQKIKHRGGMRYDGLFPFGNIAIAGNGYDPSATRNTKDIDEVVSEIKEYHIAIIKLAESVTEKLKDIFKQHGYLIGEDIVF